MSNSLSTRNVLGKSKPRHEYQDFPNDLISLGYCKSQDDNLDISSSQMNVEHQNVFVSWSGGKDCCLSLYLAKHAKLNIKCLLSIIDHTGCLGAHHLTPNILEAQAEAIGIPLVKRQVEVSSYDKDYCRAVDKLKKQENIAGGVFGDVSLGNSEAELHKTWVSRICASAEIQAYLPLWDIPRENILKMLIDFGFEVLIIVADDSRLGQDWLGKRIDEDTLRELKERNEKSQGKGVGYYHTLVIDGPIFQKRLNIKSASKVLRNDEWGSNWYLEINEYSLTPKN